ncbi:MAG: glycosyltransferase family 25 protein [Pseudomonadota bacterium]
MARIDDIVAEDYQFVIPLVSPNWKVKTVEAQRYLKRRSSSVAFKVEEMGEMVLSRTNGVNTLGEIAMDLAQVYESDWRQVLLDIFDFFIALISQGAIQLRDLQNIFQRRRILDMTAPPEHIGLEHSNPFSHFDAIFCINVWANESRWADMQTRFARLGIAKSVIRYPAVETPRTHHIGCTLSHRQLVALARKWDAKNILVFEDDAEMLDTLLHELPPIVDTLEQREWKLFYLGGFPAHPIDRSLSDTTRLRTAKSMTCTHALAYHNRSFEQILEEIPDNIAELSTWVKKYNAIDQYLTFKIDENYLATPTLSIQPVTRSFEDESMQNRYS